MMKIERFAALAMLLLIHQAVAQGTAFTYQGRLIENGARPTGIYNFTFSVHSDPALPAIVAPPLTNNVFVSNGVFTAILDFGGNAFNGQARWLEVGVRSNGSAAPHFILAPRTAITPSPYALVASKVTGPIDESLISSNVARLNGNQSFTGVVNFNPPSGQPFSVASSNKISNLNADWLDGQDSTAFWNATGNTAAASAFLGTVNSRALELRAGGRHVWHAEPGTVSPNVVGGVSGNFVTAGVSGSTIGGGGAGSQVNGVTADFGTVGGGLQNVASGTNAAISGGAFNTAAGYSSVIGGGYSNNALDSHTAVGGGLQNRATAVGATVGGGLTNSAGGVSSAIAGGQNNTTLGYAATVAGGSDNAAGGDYTLAAGRQAKALHSGSFVWADGRPTDFASTVPNQFIIRAAGGVGINTNATSDATLTVGGSTRISDNDIYLRGGPTRNDGLGWYGVNKSFGSAVPEGPVLYGFLGGVLGTTAAGPQPALSWNNSGEVRVPGLFRSGWETNNSEAPNMPGLIIRRVNSIVGDVGQVIARTDVLTLERDITPGGLRIRYPANPGRQTIVCTGVNANGSTVNFVSSLNNPPAAGTLQVYTDGQNMMFVQCMFGNTFLGQHVTEVRLLRFSGDYYWVGSLTSTFNQ